MRLRRLRLHPFAGFLLKELDLEPGLNILLGSNDVGKSTVFRAIDAALFLASKVSKSTKEGKELTRILPYGSDHARASLEFEANGSSYRLEKRWGASPSVSWEGPAGQRATQDEKMEEILGALLPVPPITYQNVLFMGQGALEGTVTALEEKRESLHSLGDFLRLAVDKNAGISVDRLKDLLEEKIGNAFRCWDRKAGLPEKGRGIENPWVKNVGTVLAAYYARERARQDARIAQASESERDRKLAELSTVQAKRDTARAFVSTNQGIVESASLRQTLDARRAKAKMENDAIVHDLNAWMQAESDRRNFAPEVERLEARRALLEEELKSVLAFAKRREILQRFEKASAAKSKLEEAKRFVSEIPALRSEDLKRLRAAQLEVDALRTSLKAGKIQLQFLVKKDFEVTVRKDLDPERKGQMTPGKGMSLSAGGRIQLSSEYFDLTVSSGEGRFNEIEESLGRKNDSLGKLFSEMKALNLEDAQEKHDKFQEAGNALKGAEALFQSALLPAEKFEDLERAVSSLSEKAIGREPELVQSEFQSVAKELGGKRDSLVKCESLLRELVRRHGLESSALLLERMAEKKVELTSLEKQLAALPALPDGMGNLDAFLERYRVMKAQADGAADEIFKLSSELAELKARLPEQSAQDLERSALEAAAAFDQELAQGRALLRVDEAIGSLESKGTDIYQGFQEEFTAQVSKLSSGKYLKATMQESLPTVFQREDGAPIPYAWLSAGTKDAFALALRLSMANYFLGGSDGFLMIDDPLVNMDPERQQIAASMLREFGEKKQLILFTCHPSHAALLGGNVIRL